MSIIPRPEHPRPDFIRDTYHNLNGTWAFAFDDANRGEAEAWYKPGYDLGGSILVHGVPPLHHAIEHWAGLAGPASSVAAMLLDALVGIAGGALALLGVQGFGAVRKLAGGGRA